MKSMYIASFLTSYMFGRHCLKFGKYSSDRVISPGRQQDRKIRAGHQADALSQHCHVQV